MKTPSSCFGAGRLGRRLLLLASALFFWSSMWLHAQTWGPFTYQRKGDTIEITEYKGTERSLAIPETIEGLTVTAITTYAFSWASVTHLNLPSTLLDAGNPPFSWAGSLQSISVAAGNPVFSSRDGVLFNKDQTRLVRVPEAWPGDTFVVPGTVNRIEDEAFRECSRLTRIVLPRGLSELGKNVFDSCRLLTHLEVEDGNRDYRSQDGVLFDARGATLIRCPEGRAGSYSVPAGVTQIGSWAFRNCQQLLHVTIPDDVESIGVGAFYQAGLQTVQVGRGVTQIGDEAFDNRRGACSGVCFEWEFTVGARIDFYFLGTLPLAEHPFGDRTRYWGSSDRSEPPKVFHLTGAAGWGSSFGGFAVTPWGGEPVILNPPVSAASYAGHRLELSAKVVGPEPIRYQWLQEDQEAPGATNAVLSLNPLKAGHAGSWRLRVSNAYGSSTSEGATVTVHIPTPDSYEAAALALGPLAYWPLNEAEDSPVIDVANGELANTFGFALLQEAGATPNTGRSIRLYGTSSIRMWHNPSRDVGTGDFTVAAWIRPSAFSQAGIAAKGGYDWAQGWLFDFSAVGEGTLRLETSVGTPGGQGTVQTLPGVVTLNEWQHVVVSCRRDPQAGPGLNTTGKGWTKIYRNGVQVAAGDIGPGNLNNPNLALVLGGISNIDGFAYFPGWMDEVALFGEALSAEQVADLFAAGTTRSTGQPVILRQPISSGGYAGIDLQLSVQAVGPEPLRFQWQKDEVDVPGTTNSILPLSALRMADAGSWRVRVSNTHGAVTSQVASVMVRVPAANSYEAAAVALGPLAYWPLDEAGGETAMDFVTGSSGNFVGAAGLGAPGATPNTGTSVSFGGAASVLAAHNPAWDVGTGDFTVAAWIRPSAFWQSGIATKGGYSWAKGWLFDFSAVGEGSLRLVTSLGNPGGQGTVQTHPRVVTLNEWQHVVVSCRRDPQAGPGLNTTGKGWTKIYRNGVQVASGDIGPGNLNNPDLSFALGTISNWRAPFPGRMDEVVLFGEALSAERAADLYAAGFGAPLPLRFTRSGEQLTLTWSGGVLQSATTLGSDGQPAGWSDLTAATSPFTLSPTNAANFFRVRTP